MTVFAAALLTILSTFPVFHRDIKTETPEDRLIRLNTYATALDRVTERATCQGEWAVPECKPRWHGSRVELALVLAGQAFQETGLSRDVHRGTCQDYECDPRKKDGKVIHLARTSWQLHNNQMIAEEWDPMVGDTQAATEAAAWAAAKMWVSSYGICGGTLEGGFAAYAGQSKTCTWSGAPRRVAFYRMIRSRWGKALKDAQAAQDIPGLDPALIAVNP